MDQMQRRHFWYRGRHRFLLYALHRYLKAPQGTARSLRMIDVGGGCGGWLSYCLERTVLPVCEAALADSSLAALTRASAVLPPQVQRWHIDLLDLPWRDRWDIMFLLDVLEHIPNDRQALQEIQRSLCPGGYLFVTTPALPFFWTWNDEVAGHQRRYRRSDFRALAKATGMELVGTHYFMFFLSFALLGRRWLCRPRPKGLSSQESWRN